MERSEIKCTCESCGKTWRKGEEGDNEEICLRCAHSERISEMDQDDRDHYLMYGDDHE